MLGAEYTVIKKGTNIITLNFCTLFWDSYGKVKVLCSKAIIYIYAKSSLGCFLKNKGAKSVWMLESKFIYSAWKIDINLE